MATTNYAIHLDGVSEHWTIADHANHDYATGNAFTFGLWFYLDNDYDSANPARTYLWSRENQHELYIDGGILFYYFNGAGGAQTWNTGIKIVPQHTYFLCLTGSESTNTSMVLYLDGESVATTTLTGAMPNDTNTSLYFGIDYGTTSGYYFKGTMTGFCQSKDTAVTAANVLTMWNDGVFDIDTTQAITGMDDSIGMEENTGTTYDNALAAGVDGAGQNTPVWTHYLDLGQQSQANALMVTGVGEYLDKRLVVRGLFWEGDTIVDADELKLTDINDKPVFQAWSKADDTGESLEWVKPRLWNGLKVATLTHGIVHIYLD